MAPIQTATSPSRPAAAVSTSTPLHGEEPTPTDLLLATPPAILKLLTLSAPVILALDSFVQLVTWTHPSFFASLLVLLSWWTLCLFGHLIVLYLLPSLLLVYIFSHYLFSASTRATSHRHRSRPATLTPAAYATLLLSAQDLASHVHTLRATIIYPISKQLSFVPHQAGKPAPAYRTAWIAITSYPFYLALTHFVPTNLIFLALGSVAILWNAPFFRTLRQALWRSAAVRWGSRIVVGLLSGGHGLKHEWEMTKKGVGIMGLLGRKKVDEAVEEKPVRVVKVGAVHEGEEEEDVQIQFTVFENQRWWVGLDWTHALLPGERASWTDPALNPSSPPSSFVLPPPSITYAPSPTRADPTSRLKRTTEWKWLDAEWSVMRTPTTSFPLKPTAPPPSGSSLPARLVSPPALLSPSTTTAVVEPDSSLAVPLPLGSDASLFLNWTVDDEGWQYGDNHFEKMGPKGGLGKYTRRRAWVRRAGLVERCERVKGEEKEVEKKSVASVGLGVSAGRAGSLRERSESGRREKRRERERETSPGGEVRRRKSSSGRNGPAPTT